MGGSERLRRASRRGRDQTQDWARCCPLRFRSGRPRRLPHCSPSRSCRIWGTLGRPLGLPSLLVFAFSFSSSFLLPPFPFYSLILLDIPSCGPVAFSSTTGLGQWLAQGAQGSFLGGDGGGSGGGGGRGSPAPAATELVGDLGSFLLLGSHLSLDSTTLPSLLQLKASPGTSRGGQAGHRLPLIMPGLRWQPRTPSAGGASGPQRCAIQPTPRFAPHTWLGAGTVRLGADSGTPGAW